MARMTFAFLVGKKQLMTFYKRGMIEMGGDNWHNGDVTYPESSDGKMITWHREDFIQFLKETLIPDLKLSGNHSTAEDFETAVFFMDTIPTVLGTGCVIQRQKRVYRRYDD